MIIKRLLAVVTALMVISFISYARQSNNPNKKDLKKMERAEKQRKRDSVARVQDSLMWVVWNVKDSIKRENRKKEEATVLIGNTSVGQQDALLILARSLSKAGRIIQLDKEIGTIVTDRRSVSGLSGYLLHFFVEPTHYGSQVRVVAYSNGSLSVPSIWGFVRTAEVQSILEYDDDNTAGEAWKEMEDMLSQLPNITLEYHKQ